MTLRILLIIDMLGSGGAQRQMVTLARGLKRRGHDVEMFVYYPQHDHLAAAVVEAGIPIHSCAKRHRYSLEVPTRLRELARRGGYDVMLSFLDTPNLYAEWARIGRRRPPLVVSERSVYPTGRLGARRWGRQQAHRIADVITVNSHHQHDRMIARFPWMKAKLRVIYNGIDLEQFRDSPVPALAPGEPLRLLAIGRIRPEKNSLGLVRALEAYRQAYGAPPRVSWAGKDVPSKDGLSSYEPTVALLNELGLGESWEWLGERSDIPAIIREHHALIHPSLFEGLPNAVCEAMACGRPALVSNVCELPRLVTDGRNGLLFDPERPQSIAAAIHRFRMLDDDDRAAMGRAARLFTEDVLDTAQYVSAYESLFLELGDRGRG